MPADTHDRRWWILAVLCIVVVIIAVDNTIVNVALPMVSRQLHASNSSLQWIVDAYSLPFAGLLLAGGGMSDRWGRKRVMQLALATFGAFSLLAAFSHDVSTLLVARALMGASAAFMFPATLSTLTTVFDDTASARRPSGCGARRVGSRSPLAPSSGGRSSSTSGTGRSSSSTRRWSSRRCSRRTTSCPSRRAHSSDAIDTEDCSSARRACRCSLLRRFRDPRGVGSARRSSRCMRRASSLSVASCGTSFVATDHSSICASSPTAPSPRRRARSRSTTSLSLGSSFSSRSTFSSCAGTHHSRRACTPCPSPRS